MRSSEVGIAIFAFLISIVFMGCEDNRPNSLIVVQGNVCVRKCKCVTSKLEASHKITSWNCVVEEASEVQRYKQEHQRHVCSGHR